MFIKSDYCKDIMITVDDLGLSGGINKAIEELIADGIISNASLMVNMSRSKEGYSIVKEKGLTNPSIHINLTVGKPVSNTNKISTLVTKHQYFRNLFNFVVRVLLRLIKSSHLEREIESQIIISKDWGIDVKMINSHHNIHLIPRLSRIFISLMKKHNIEYIRSAYQKKIYIKRPFIRKFILFPIIKIYARKFHRYAQKNNIIINDGLYGLWERGITSPLEILRIANNDRVSRMEIVFHAGYVDNDLLNLDDYTYKRENELEILKSVSAKKLIKKILSNYSF